MAVVRIKSVVSISVPTQAEGAPILAPATGQVEWNPASPLPLSSETFSIKIENDTVYSPLSAIITNIQCSFGKVELKTRSGLMFELAFPQSYERFMGQGIKPLVKSGVAVKKGQPLLHLDLFKMKNNLSQLLLFVKVFNLNMYKKIHVPYRYVEARQDALVTLVVKKKK
mgnify:FL=1